MSINIDIDIVTTIDNNISKITSIINKKNICIEEVKKLNKKIKEIEILKNSNNAEVLQIKYQLEDKENSLKDNIQQLKKIEKEIHIYKQKSYIKKKIDEIRTIINIADINLNKIQKLHYHHTHIYNNNKNIYDNFIKLKEELNEIKKLLSLKIFNNEEIIETEIIELVSKEFDLISKKCKNKEEFLEEVKIASIKSNDEYKEAIKEYKKIDNEIKNRKKSFIHLLRSFDYSYAEQKHALHKKRNFAKEEEYEKKNIAQLYILIVKFINELDFCKIKQLINLINNKLIVLLKLENETNYKNIEEIIDEICELIIIPDKKVLNSITDTKSKLKKQNIYENVIEEFFNTEIKLHNEIVNELIEKISIPLSKPQEIFDYNKIIFFITEKLDLIIEKCKINDEFIQQINEEAIEASNEAIEARNKAIETRNETHEIKNEVYKAREKSAQAYLYLSEIYDITDDKSKRDFNSKIDIINENNELLLEKELEEEQQEEKEEEQELLAETKEYTAQLKIYKVKYINELNYCRIKELIEELIKKLIEEKDKKLYEKFDELKIFVEKNILNSSKNMLNSTDQSFLKVLLKIIRLEPLEPLEINNSKQQIIKDTEKYILDNKEQIIKYLEKYILDNNTNKFINLFIYIYGFLILLKDPINFNKIKIKFDEIDKIITSAKDKYINNISEHVYPDDPNGYYESFYDNFNEFNEIKNKLELNNSNNYQLESLELEKKIIKLVKNKISTISEKCENKEQIEIKVNNEIEIKKNELKNEEIQLMYRNYLFNEEMNKKWFYENKTNLSLEKEKDIIRMNKNIEHIKKNIILTEYKKKYLEEFDNCKIKDIIEEIETIIKPKSKEEIEEQKQKQEQDKEKKIKKIVKIEPKPEPEHITNMLKIIEEIEESIKDNNVDQNNDLLDNINKIKEYLKINEFLINNNKMNQDYYISINKYIKNILNILGCDSLTNRIYSKKNVIMCKIKEKFDNLKGLLIISNPYVILIIEKIENTIEFPYSRDFTTTGKRSEIFEQNNIKGFVELFKNNLIEKYDDIIVTIDKIIIELNFYCNRYPKYNLCDFLEYFKILKTFIS